VITEGTVRAAATLRAQSPQARAAIRAALRDTVTAYKRGQYFEIRCPPLSPQQPSHDADAQHSAAPDCLQRPLRSRFQPRLPSGVGQKKQCVIEKERKP
jgi:hypothetical protein